MKPVIEYEVGQGILTPTDERLNRLVYYMDGSSHVAFNIHVDDGVNIIDDIFKVALHTTQ